jgi:MFS family permease
VSASAPSDHRVIAAAILLIAFVGVSLSVFIPLLSIAMERMQITATLSGLNTAAAGIGTLAIAPFVPGLAARFGVRSILFIAILVAAIMAIGFPLTPFALWFPLRFVFGAAIGTLFVLSEYWINAAAPEDRRGMVMGIYATVLSLGFAAGPLVLLLTGTQGTMPYLAGAGIILLALVPLLLGRGTAPQISGGGKTPALSMMTMVPAATCAALVFGAIETGGFALFPVYGLRNAMPETTAATLISIVAAGNVVSQIPLGWLSDRMDRPRLLLICALVGVLGCIAMPFTIAEPRFFFAVLFIWGGFTGGLYTVGLAHLGSRFTGADLANANAAFVMLYSIGLIAGPPFVGAGMDLLGSHGFAAALALMLALYAGLIAGRMTLSKS